MDKSYIPILAELLEAYHDPGEVIEVGRIFEIEFEEEGYGHGRQEWLSIARQLVDKIDHGLGRALVRTLFEQIEVRNARAIATTTWERREANEALRPLLTRLRAAFEASGAPAEIVVAENKPFTAKSEIREFLESAETEVLVVDPYIGVGTLDCLRSVDFEVRLLTGTLPHSVGSDFAQALRVFQSEGLRIEVRRHPDLHDRHVVFNNRCWLAGSSFKDAGKKAFHAIEITDARQEVIASLTAKLSVTRFNRHLDSSDKFRAEVFDEQKETAIQS